MSGALLMEANLTPATARPCPARHGLGHAKAFGCGLLLVRRIAPMLS